MYEGQLEHAQVVLRGLFEASQNPPAFLEPADKAFDDVSFTIGLSVEINVARVAVFVGFGRDHRNDLLFEQVLVDPVGAISFVAGQPNGAQHLFAILPSNFDSFQKCLESLRLMRLPCRNMHVQGMTVAITEQMYLCRKSAPRTT